MSGMNSKAQDMMKQALLKRRGKIPESMKTSPQNDIYTNWYKRAFNILTKSRPNGMGLWYIPLSEILLYGKEIGHVEETIEDFIEIIQAMDSVFLAHESRGKKK